jgi:hypothetical protein
MLVQVKAEMLQQHLIGELTYLHCKELLRASVIPKLFLGNISTLIAAIQMSV